MTKNKPDIIKRQIKSKKMRALDPNIKLQKELWDQIYKSLQGDVTEAIQFYSSSVAIDNSVRSKEEGVMMKVGEGLLTDYYHLCLEVKNMIFLSYALTVNTLFVSRLLSLGYKPAYRNV